MDFSVVLLIYLPTNVFPNRYQRHSTEMNHWVLVKSAQSYKNRKGKITREVSIAEQAIIHCLHVTMRNVTEFEKVPNRVFSRLIAIDTCLKFLLLALLF